MSRKININRFVIISVFALIFVFPVKLVTGGEYYKCIDQDKNEIITDTPSGGMCVPLLKDREKTYEERMQEAQEKQVKKKRDAIISSERKRVEQLNKCLERVGDLYNERWDTSCKNRNLPAKCALSVETAKRLDSFLHAERSECLNYYK